MSRLPMFFGIALAAIVIYFLAQKAREAKSAIDKVGF